MSSEITAENFEMRSWPFVGQTDAFPSLGLKYEIDYWGYLWCKTVHDTYEESHRMSFTGRITATGKLDSFAHNIELDVWFDFREGVLFDCSDERFVTEDMQRSGVRRCLENAVKLLEKVGDRNPMFATEEAVTLTELKSLIEKLA